jgi:hypothetical protein
MPTLCRLRQGLAPYLSTRSQPQLVEVIADRNKHVSLRLSDRTSQDLSYCIDIQDALSMLLEARQQWLLQGMDTEESQQQGLDEVAGVTEQGQQGQQQQQQGFAGAISSSSLQLARSVSGASSTSSSGPAGTGLQLSAVSLAWSLAHPAASFDAMFGSDNRMGVPGSLHRISAMRNRQ